MSKYWDHYRKIRELDLKRPQGAPFEGIPKRRQKVAEYIARVSNGGFTLELGMDNHRFLPDSIALDINRTFLSIPGEKIEADWHYMPFKADVFDQVIWSEGPEHSHDPSSVFSEIARVLKKDGQVIVTCPNGNAIPDWQHLTSFNTTSLKELLVKFFLKVEVEEWEIYLLGYGVDVR